MQEPDDDDVTTLEAAVRANVRAFRAAGWALVVLGTLSVLFPLFASIAVKLMLGWLFLLTGAVTLWHAFQSRDWAPALWSALVGVVHLALGVYLAFFPMTGLIALTVVLALVLGLEGVFQLALAWAHRPGHGMSGPAWLWIGFAGVVSLALALLLVSGLPGTAMWALGMLVGVNFLSTGVAFVFLARASLRP